MTVIISVFSFFVCIKDNKYIIKLVDFTFLSLQHNVTTQNTTLKKHSILSEHGTNGNGLQKSIFLLKLNNFEIKCNIRGSLRRNQSGVIIHYVTAI